MNTRAHYSKLAAVFRYPGEDFIERLETCLREIGPGYPDAKEELAFFTEYMKACPPERREEIYTKTFDVQPICYLDLGYVIFGEDYKRGAFLLHMQEEQLRAGNDCGSDLPDNLSNMLTLFSISQDEKLLYELATDILIPGLKKMTGEFEQARVELKEKVLRKLHKALIDHDLNFGNVYRNALQALLYIVQTDFPRIAEPEPQSADESFAGASTDSFFRRRNEAQLENNFKLD